MNVAAAIESKVEQSLSPAYLRVENESHMHGGPATESHFKLVVVTEEFSSLSRVKRHQRLYQILEEELRRGVHALAMHLYTPAEWMEFNQRAPASPDCLGGSKPQSES